MSRENMGLPIRPFLYTLDQIATLIAVELPALKRVYVYFQGRHVGPVPPDKMHAINIAPDGEKPDWRVAEKEFKRWLRNRGWRVYDRSSLS